MNPRQPTTKFVRNKNQPQSTPNSPPSSTPQPTNQSTLTKKKSLPKMVSELSPNIIFQHLDGQNEIRDSLMDKQHENSTDPTLEKQSMGLISNVFMSSTNKFVKGVTVSELDKEKVEKESSTTGRFGRSKNTPIKSEIIQDSDKKIERKYAGNHRQLKFVDKKEDDNAMETPRFPEIQSVITPDKNEKKTQQPTFSRKPQIRSHQNSVQKQSNRNTPEKQQKKPAYYNPYKRSQPKTVQKSQTSSIVQQPTGQKPIISPYKPLRRTQPEKSIVSERKSSQNDYYNPYKKAQEETSEKIEQTTIEPKAITKPYRKTQPFKQVGLQPKQTENKPAPTYTPYRKNQPRQEQQRQTSEIESKSITPTPKPYRRNQNINSNTNTNSQLSENTEEKQIKTTPRQKTPSKTFNYSKNESEKNENENKRINQTSSKTQTKTQIYKTSSHVQGKNKQSQKNENETIHVKKSNVCLSIISKLIKKKLILTFEQLRLNAVSFKRQQTSLASLLCYNSVQIVKAKEFNLISQTFLQLKKIFTSQYIAQLKQQISKVPTAHKASPYNLIHQLYLNKFRQYFISLHSYSQNEKNKMNQCHILERLIKSKQKINKKICFSKILIISKNYKYYVDELHSIMKVYYKTQTGIYFQKLVKYHPSIPPHYPPHPKKTTRSGSRKDFQNVNPQIQKINQQKITNISKSNSQISQQINNLQNQLNGQINAKDNQEQELKSKIATLEQTNKYLSKEIQLKREHCFQIKSQISLLQTQRHISDEVITSETKLQELSKIFIQSYYDPKEMFFASEVMELHRLTVTDDNPLITQWKTLLHNIQLKRLIAAFQKTEQPKYRARQNLIQQQKVLIKLITSYLREQYCWKWVILESQL